MIKKFKDFNNINEGLLSNLFNKLKGYLSDGLKDLMKDVKSGEPKKMIRSLKKYAQLNANEIDNKLKEIKTEDELKEFLKETIYGLYSAIKGIQSTKKIDSVYFEEMFKKADKNFVKLMNKNQKKFDKALDVYLDKYLIPGLYKLAGVKSNESFLYEADENKDEDKSDKEIPDKLKKATKNWLGDIFSPILKIKTPKPDNSDNSDNKNNNNSKVIPTKDGSQVRKEVVQDLTKNASLNQIKKFREIVGNSRNMNKKEFKNKWPVGK